MANKPQMLSPRHPLVDSNGMINREWYRSFNNVVTNSGTVAEPLVVQSSVFLNDATVSAGGTISSPDLPAGTLIGNGGTTVGQATTLDIDPSLLLSNGTLAIAPLPAGTLMGNSGSAAATPGPIEVAGNLVLQDGTLTADSTNLETLLYSIPDRSGQIAALERKVNDALTLAMLPAPASGSSAAAVTVNPDSLFGNAGTVAATGTSIAIGAGLSLSAGGTLSASGTAIYAPLVNGDLPGPTLIADPYGQCIMVQIR
jgi:hypothetical protein